MAVRFEGLDELREALRQLPTELRDEAAGEIRQTTERTASKLRQAYPEGATGNLRRSVRTEFDQTAFGARGTVVSASRHAHLWEFGTTNRRTRQGWNRGRGPAHQREGLVSIATRERRTLQQKLLDLVRRAGFEVSGSFE